MKMQRGFSLLELLIVVAIMAVLAGLAIPAYQGYILRAKQGAAQSVLLDIAQKQPQFMADRRSTYAGCLSASYLYPNLTAATCAANHLSITPQADIAALYGFSITLIATPPGYIANAIPISVEVGTTSFHIDHSGNRVTGVSGVPGTTKW